jgi:hypothetical protein
LGFKNKVRNKVHPEKSVENQANHAPQNEMLIKGELMAKAGNFYLKFGHQPEG